MVLFFGFSLAKISTHSLAFEDLQNTNLEIIAVPIAQVTVPIMIQKNIEENQGNRKESFVDKVFKNDRE